MYLRRCRLITSLVLALCSSGVANAAPQTSSGDTPAATAQATPIADLTEIKIQMAEARLKLVQSERNLNALISGLEEYINAKCFVGLSKTLKYSGPPTDPTCVARMEQLLKVNPDNPAALCLRDGIDAPSCINGYKTQQVVEFYESESLLNDLPDPSLKVGLSAAETERIKVQQGMLSNINSKYRQAKTDDEKAKLVKDAVGIYDQLLATACRVSSLRLRRVETPDQKPSEPSRIAEARRKLLQVPPEMRADYQRQMREATEDELSKYKGDTRGKNELIQLLAVIDDPSEKEVTIEFRNLQRSRIVLPTCFRTLDQIKGFLPLFPGTSCFGQGFQTPQCVQALRAWRQEKERERKAEMAKLALTPGAVTPTPSSIIASF